MTLQFTPFVILLSLSSGIAALLAVYAWSQRANRSSTYFALLMGSVSLWALISAAELATQDISSKITWSKLSFIGINNIAPLWLMFSISYSRPIRPPEYRRAALLWIIPCLMLLAVWTNEWHGLIWTQITPVAAEPSARLHYEYGIGMLINIIYAYSLLMAGALRMLQVLIRAPRLYRRQSGAILVGLLIPWIANILYLADLNPWPGIDITPVAFTVSGILLSWAMLRYATLNIVPVARDTLVDHMNDGVIVLDSLNRVVDINSAACQMLGTRSEAVIGKSGIVLLSQFGDLTDYFRDPVEMQTEYRIEGKVNDNPIWYDVRLSMIQDGQNRVTGRLITLRNITSSKAAESILQEYTRELEARNAELDAFAHTVAHDLKAPLSVLVGYSALLDDEEVALTPDEQREAFTSIFHTATRMSDIIDSLLLLASVRRMDQVKTQPLNMAHIVNEAQKRLLSMSIRAKAQIEVQSDWPTVRGYAPWVVEVWANYLSNALKYGGTPPHITLGFDPLLPGAAEARFWVRDSGAGIAESEQHKLFAEFTRLGDGRLEGHGLGLSIVRRIIERLSGTVGVVSREGEGSTFYFTLPLTDDPVILSATGQKNSSRS